MPAGNSPPAVPPIRVQVCRPAPLRPGGDFVLYWSLTARRPKWNFALQRAAGWAAELNKPLLVLETLVCDYPWASARLHRFILEAMAADRQHYEHAGVAFFPFAERKAGECAALVQVLGARACVVVTDEFPCFFLPAYIADAAQKMGVRVEQVDSNGLLPLRAADRTFPTAYAFRRYFQQNAPRHLAEFPAEDPLAKLKLPRLARLPTEISKRFSPADAALAEPDQFCSGLPIDQAVQPVPTRGGCDAAGAALRHFLSRGLERYATERSAPESDASSGLSPWLHFGHLSVHEVVATIMREEHWAPARLGAKTHGKREGWWGMSAAAEAFLDELIIWRELGYNFCFHRPDYDQFKSLPEWAQATLAKHAQDKRKWSYDLAAFEQAATHDPLWNAAQNQLLREGRMHNYLRMLWGKKILEWSASPQAALQIMIELNNKYALDGRDPNSYTGIFWVLGRFDRPWAPERPIFGVIRYMSSENTARKFSVKGYLARYGAALPVQGELGFATPR